MALAQADNQLRQDQNRLKAQQLNEAYKVLNDKKADLEVI